MKRIFWISRTAFTDKQHLYSPERGGSPAIGKKNLVESKTIEVRCDE